MSKCWFMGTIWPLSHFMYLLDNTHICQFDVHIELTWPWFDRKFKRFKNVCNLNCMKCVPVIFCLNFVHTKNTFQFAFVSKICLIYQQLLFECLEGVVEMFSLDKFPVFFPCTACLKEHWGIMNEYDFVTQDHVKQLSWRSQLLCRQNKELGWTAFCVEHQTRELGTLGDYQIR